MNESILIKVQQKLQDYENLLILNPEIHLWEKEEVLRMGESIYDILDYLEKNDFSSHADVYIFAEHLLGICFFHAGDFNTARNIFKKSIPSLHSNFLFYQILNDLFYFQFDCPSYLKFKTKLSILDSMKKLPPTPLHRYLLCYAWHIFDLPSLAQNNLIRSLIPHKEELKTFHQGMHFSMFWVQLHWNTSWIQKMNTTLNLL